MDFYALVSKTLGHASHSAHCKHLSASTNSVQQQQKLKSHILFSRMNLTLTMKTLIHGIIIFKQNLAEFNDTISTVFSIAV